MDQEEDHADASRNEWELSKENVQPLKKGRIVSNLVTGLQHSGVEMTKLREQKQAFEYQLRMYSGDDPLSVWYCYIRWIQQNFPSGGPETGLQTLLESCVTKFKDAEKYLNDERFVEVWLNLLVFQTEPLEIFNFMMNKGIGVNVASFYCAWADNLELVGNFKKAESIYQLGMSKMAYPVQNIRARYAEFQQRAMKASGIADSTEPTEPQRQSLVSLKGHGKHKVAGMERQTMKMPKLAKAPLSVNNDQKFTIFSDGGATGQTPMGQAKSEWATVPKQAKVNAENISNPAQWTKSKAAAKKAAASSVAISDVSRMQNPGFQVHVDENVPDTPSGKSLNIGVLSERKAEKPVSAHDIVNRIMDSPGKKAMYPKAKVYGGVVELSLEEIRARKIFERKKARKEMEAVIRKELEQQQQQSNQQMRELQQQVERLTNQLMHLQPSNQSQATVPPQAVKKSQTVRNLGFSSAGEVTQTPNIPQIQVTEQTPQPPQRATVQQAQQNVPRQTMQPQQIPQITPQPQHAFQPIQQEPPRTLPRKSIVKTPTLSMVAEDSKLEIPSIQQSFHSGEALAEDSTTPNKSTTSQNTSSDRTPGSLTMNTKEAMHVIQGMFNHTLKADDLGFDDESGILEDSRFAMKTGHQAHGNFLAKTGFDIFTDPDGKNEGQPKDAFHIFTDPEPPQSVGAEGGFKFATADESKKSIAAGGSFQIYQEPSRAAPFQIHADAEPTPRANPPISNPGLARDPISDLEGPVDDEMTFAPLSGSTRKFPGIQQTMDADMTFNPGFASTRIFAPISATPMTQGEGMTFFDATEKTESHPGQTPQSASTTATETTTRFATTTACCNLSTIAEGSSEKTGSSGNNDTTNHFCGHTIPASQLDTNKTGHTTTHSAFPEAKSLIGGHIDDDLDKLIGLEPTPKKEVFKEPPKPVLRDASIRMENSARMESSMKELSIASSMSESRSSTSSLEPNRQHVIDTTQYTPSDPSRSEDLLSQTIAIDPGLNPFADDVIEDLLAGLEVPVTQFPGYTQLQDPLPSFPEKGMDAVVLGDEIYHVESKIGEGAFASVYLASKLNNEDFDDVSGTDDKRAIKVQKPACPWEFYMISVVHSRLSETLGDVDVRPSLMNIDTALFYTDGSCLINQFHPHGTVLTLVNAHKTVSDRLPELFVAYVAVELLYIAEALIKCGVIHGDIKPDNLLFLGPPNLKRAKSMPQAMGGKNQSVKLVDFGRGIDMKLLPEGTNFTAKVNTSGFQCIEMQTDKPWTHQTDLFGIVGTIHVMIFNQYMNVYNSRGRWRTTGKIPRRWDSKMWDNFFDTLLNIESCESIPDIAEVRKPFEEFLLSKFWSGGTMNLLPNWPLR